MAINKSYISTADAERYGASVIQMMGERPPVTGFLSVKMIPGQIVGYYNGNRDIVELYVVAGSGYKLLRVG